MILAMSSDIRIIIVKLADRIHNMRTLEFQSPDKQKYISRETLDIYAPLANRLGINWMKIEFEDLSFKFLNAAIYQDLSRRIALKKEQRDEYTKEVMGILLKEISSTASRGKSKGGPSIFTAFTRR